MQPDRKLLNVLIAVCLDRDGEIQEKSSKNVHNNK